MIKTKKRGSLIIISGTTCAGKGTVINELLKRNDNLDLIVSYTSRPMRTGDIEGKDYHFISKKEFEWKIANDEFLEYALVHNSHYYGTPKIDIEKKLASGKDVLLEIEVQGAQIIKQKMPETILIFIMPPSMAELKRRIYSRNKDDEEQIFKRFESAYKEINEVGKYNYVVVNEDLEEAVHKVEAILTSVKCRVDRIEDIFVENKEEMMHEFLMGGEFENKHTPIE